MARFVEPRKIFEIVEARNPGSDFLERRLSAQVALDRIGQPYTIYQIYDAMVSRGTSADLARKLLHHEIEVERDNLIPIHRNVARVGATDVIISDMYLSSELISSFLYEICDLNTHLPVVMSNWGKHTGTIWKELLKNYVIRRHFGDDPRSDYEVPKKYHIECELVSDNVPSPWETEVRGMGLDGLALVQREVRLRCLPVDAGVIHDLICGPYLALLTAYAVYLMRRFGETATFAFLSRDGDDLSRVFRAFFPSVCSFNIDLSRRLTRNQNLDPVLSTRITDSTVLVDVLSTGRSFFAFAERTGTYGKAFVTLLLLEGLLNPQEKQLAAQRAKAGRLHHVASVPAGVSHYPLECLLQSHYPPVSMVLHDPLSGGIVKSFAAHELNQSEQQIVIWKSAVVTEFVRTVRRRGLAPPNEAQWRQLMEKSVNVILQNPDIVRAFPSFMARERFNPF
jgi:hypothetical protein